MTIKSAPNKRSRIILDVPRDLRKKIKIVAAWKDTTIRDYILGAVAKRLEEEPAARGDILPLNFKSDPVLAALWDNPNDAKYDRL